MDEAEGRYFTECSLTGSPCNLCRGYKESPSCVHGLLSIRGLSGIDAKRISTVYSVTKNDRLAYEVFLRTGEVPWDVATKDNAQKDSDGIPDPFSNFPKDGIPFKLTENEIDERVKASKLEVRLNFGKNRVCVPWDEKRVNAAKGLAGELAQRCSVQDFTWLMFSGIENPTTEHMRKKLRVWHLMHLLEIEKNADKKNKMLKKLESL